MTTHRDLSRVSVSDLSQLTGVTRETATKRLRESNVEPISQNGRSQFYDPKLALPVVLGMDGASLNPQVQRARLDKARAEESEFRLARERGEWIAAVEYDRALIALATAASAKMQGLPCALAPLVAAETSAPRCERILDDAIRGALEDLANEGDRAAERLAEASKPTRKRRKAAR